jgi:hypothetical protein
MFKCGIRISLKQELAFLCNLRWCEKENCRLPLNSN